MENKCNRYEYQSLVKEVEKGCEQYRECCAETELRAECAVIREKLEGLCREGVRLMDVERPELLVALMDAYEVTQDEVMLQEVLDVVSGNLERLEASAESVRLLAYCYYYVEEQECADRAKAMLDVLRLRGDGKNVEMAEQVYRELVEESGV